MTDKSYIDTQDMVVTDFRVTNLSGAVKEWRDQSNVFMAESCARQIWLGSKDTFSTFPQDDLLKTAKNFTLAHGKDAYSLLVKLNLGLLSKIEGETNIAGQFQLAWRGFKDQSPDQAKPFEKLVQHITGDSRLIRHHVLDGWKIKNRELCARDLSDMRHGDSVLIIGHASPNGSMSAVTDNIARKITNNAGRTAREVCITHPDHSVTASLLKDMSIAKSNGTIPASLTSMDFYDDLALAFEYYDRVYCTLPMGLNPDADDFIISCWKGKSEGNNTLAHLLGKQEKGTPIPENWTKAKLQNFITPRDIDKEMDKRGAANTRLLESAHSAIEHCTTLRLEARQASAKTLRDAGVPSSKPMPQEFVPLHSPQCG